ncbi:MAG: zinc ABC transporter substrate-binding protein [Bacteroidetes Order II. Incertae sedis bacterium]|nr:zinc ABC transporter substrate-binding protein [Bacteroidetes Order II. bacterium]
MNKLLYFVLGVIFVGCTRPQADDQEKFRVVTTTGMIADAAKEIGREHVSVKALMGPGVDPHLYKATQGDLLSLMNADLVLYNGLHLEGKMGEVLEKLARRKPVMALGQMIPSEKLLHVSDAEEAIYDPHIWFDVSLWQRVAEAVGQKLAEMLPDKQLEIRTNTTTYLAHLRELEDHMRSRVAEIPQEHRILLTAHDAFGYFGRAYGFRVVGLQGISTAGEYGLGDIRRVVQIITQNRIKAVFVESSISPRAIEAVVEGAKQRGQAVHIGGHLFSDAMGQPGTSESTYVGMMRYNINTIVQALK